MAYKTSETRMCVAYNNRLNSSEVSSVAVANITPDAGFPASNLGHEDPWLMMKTSGTSASDRQITWTLGASSPQSTCFGIMNHNLFSAGYQSIRLEYHNGTTFVNVATDVSIAGRLGDPNFLLRFPSAIGTTQWRLTILQASGTRQAFYIGACFLGVYHEVTESALDGQVFHEQSIQMEPLVSAGGARFYRPGPVRHDERYEVSFARMSQAGANTLTEGILRTNRGRVVGIIPSECLDLELPIGTQHLFGRLESIVAAPVTGFAGSASHKYNVTMSLQGAT